MKNIVTRVTKESVTHISNLIFGLTVASPANKVGGPANLEAARFWKTV